MPDSKAHVVLDAIQYATEADLKSLRQIISVHRDALKLELVLRILLTYLPESIEPSHYIPLLQPSSNSSFSGLGDDHSITRPSNNLSIQDAKSRIRRVKLLPLRHAVVWSQTTDLLESFLYCRAYRIEAEVGSIALICDLFRPFLSQYPGLRQWAASTILPLEQLEQKGSQESSELSITSLSSLRDRSGLDILLQESPAKLGHDHSQGLRTIVGPWMLGEVKRREIVLEESLGSEAETQATVACWNNVNNWLIDLAGRDYTSAVITYKHWSGPSDVDYGEWLPIRSTDLPIAVTGAYQQVGLALIYLCPERGHERQIELLIRVVADRTAVGLSEELTATSFSTYRSRVPDAFLESIAQIHLTQAELLDSANPLTTASNHAIQFVHLASVSALLLESLGIALSIQQTVSLALHDPQSSHSRICTKAIHEMASKCGKDDRAWLAAREKLLWLRDWNTGVQPGQARQGILSQVNVEEIHVGIFENLVTHGRYQIAIDLYCRSSSPLPQVKVKDALINVILAAYDNASNGNKTRGGIKKAAEVITTFQPHFPGFQRLVSIWALIQATHRLSFYSLTLQHGVPLSPVNIRIHQDPLTLIDNVTKQNPQSYTKLDDLLDIGRDLVKAGRITFQGSNGADLPIEEALQQVEQAVTAKAISASLSEDDFDTAYSYIVNRLSTMSSSDSTSSDHLWRAAYQAGRYTSRKVSSTSPSALRRLEQRMELLSQALLLAPQPSLEEVLSTWRSCEKDLNVALARETREEEAWQAKGDRTLPGNFSLEDVVPMQTKAREHTRRVMDEEAPMGLFDVARGAAAALSKSAFPLGAQAGRASGETDRSDDDAPQRLRKRDMVSNMVTGGLASGIGWVIGAPPAKQDA